MSHENCAACTPAKPSLADQARMDHEIELQSEKTRRALNEKRFELAKAFALAVVGGGPVTSEEVALIAVRHADAILAELAKPREEKP